jgi:phage terminase large subunit GpA-like protein
MAKRLSKQRLESLITETPCLAEKIAPARARDSGNTMFSKEFPGGLLLLTGANSATGLRSTPCRYIFMDEVDAFPADVDGEGDPVSLAEKRRPRLRGARSC